MPLGKAEVGAMGDLAQQVRAAVRHELASFREHPYHPPPFDGDAERAVLSALLRGERRPSQLPCVADDFFFEIHRGLFDVLDTLERTPTGWPAADVPRLDAVLAWLEQYGSVERMRRYTGELYLRPLPLDDIPFYHQRNAERVRVLAVWRRGAVALEAVCGMLRGLHAPTDEQLDVAEHAIAALRGARGEAAPNGWARRVDWLEVLERAAEQEQSV